MLASMATTFVEEAAGPQKFSTGSRHQTQQCEDRSIPTSRAERLIPSSSSAEAKEPGLASSSTLLFWLS